MQIISGKYKGRKINGFTIDGTRPTMDRVKESLFATIQANIKGARVLDLFAGSGNLGLESLSNGAIYACFVDKNKKCIDTIKENVNNIQIAENVKIINSDYQKAIKLLKETGEKFDIVFLDPPYHEKLLNASICQIINNNLLNANALLIAEYETEMPICDLTLIKEKKYGDKFIRIYKLEN